MMMIETHGAFKHIVAFEVSKSTLVVHTLPQDRQTTIANTPQAVRRLLRAELKHNAKAGLGRLLVIAEATGGYERHTLDAAVELGLACHRAHGSRVRFYAKYRGQDAKTDAIDAALIADYGAETKTLRLYQPLRPQEQALKDLQSRREEILQMLIAEGNRLEHIRHPSVSKSITAHIASLRKALEAIEDEIAAVIRSDEQLDQKARLMKSVPGVGPVTAATLLANMPELGAITKGQAAKLAGLAPINRDSGKHTGQRRAEPGRAAVRRCLYMAALVAMKANPVIKAFAESLRARGKPFKLVITAAMRKLIVILNAVVREAQPCKTAKTA
jgi:transposase